MDRETRRRVDDQRDLQRALRLPLEPRLPRHRLRRRLRRSGRTEAGGTAICGQPPTSAAPETTSATMRSRAREAISLEGGQRSSPSHSTLAGPPFDSIAQGLNPPGPIPQAPGVERNSFRGPRYFNIDATVSKAFGLPTMPALGDAAKLEIRANFYNLFNQVNLSNIQNNILDQHFGEAQDGLAGRSMELQARFSF